MERTTWTDERLDDLNARVDRNLDLVLEEIRLLRAEMNAELRLLREEMHAGFRQLQQAILGLVGAMIATMAAVVVSLS